MKTFHFAKLDDSPRLRRVLAFMRERGAAGATTMDIIQGASTTRPPSDMSELAANGIQHVCRYEGTNGNSAKVYRYWLAEFAP